MLEGQCDNIREELMKQPKKADDWGQEEWMWIDENNNNIKIFCISLGSPIFLIPSNIPPQLIVLSHNFYCNHNLLLMLRICVNRPPNFVDY